MTIVELPSTPKILSRDAGSDSGAQRLDISAKE